ncbi:unnamed protein product [Tuber aestivum]|uniref:Uncharacterized protein n=1 Tax=Tuber aestivum TaxID=59557 RepID=A0A292PQH5_9PEZI|nr:unnamed protein product [Tuber aestivum]
MDRAKVTRRVLDGEANQLKHTENVKIWKSQLTSSSEERKFRRVGDAPTLRLAQKTRDTLNDETHYEVLTKTSQENSLIKNNGVHFSFSVYLTYTNAIPEN